MSTRTKNELLNAALAYAKRGWAVFPLEGKTPFENTHGHKDATTNAQKIKRWWKQHPKANIGIACSSKNGPIVLDQDGPDGKELLRAEIGNIPATLKARSGKKGIHYYFAPDGEPIKRTIKIQGKSLDLLGDGGYVVAPPSVHPETGRAYKWLRERDPVRLPKSIRNLIAKGRSKKGLSPRLPTIIREGSRDTWLTSAAGTMRRRGFEATTILDALRLENEQKCDPPLPDKEIVKIARNSEQWEPVPFDLTPEQLDDMTLADRFGEIERPNVRYVIEWKEWAWWDGTRWAREGEQEVERRIKDMIRGLARMIVNSDLKDPDEYFKKLKPYRNRQGRERILKDAREVLQIRVSDFDNNPWLLNVMNGTLDLKWEAGMKTWPRLKPHDPEDLITTIIPVDFNRKAQHAEWNGFLKVALRDNPDIDWNRAMDEAIRDDALIRYVRALVGYSLTGDVREDALPFVYGPTRSGKGTFVQTIRAMLGDYAVVIDFNTLLEKKYASGEGRHDITRLYRKRAAFASECPPEAQWNVAQVKNLTGGDEQRGREHYRKAFGFWPTHKVWAQANDRPGAYDPSDAIWTRLKCIPFDHTVPPEHRDEALRERLITEELSGILNWALEGCRDWQKYGLWALTPERVTRLLAEYRNEQAESDPVQRFLDEYCTIDRKKRWWTPAADIDMAFTSLWRDLGMRGSPPLAKLKGAMRLLKLQSKRKAWNGRRTRGWYGIKLNGPN